MAEPIAEVGYLAGICGSEDGTDWEKILVDSSRRLVVAIASAVAQQSQMWAWDGSDWVKAKCDSEGKLEVVLSGGLEYVDRGDPAALDYTIATLTADGAWHDLDLSAIVTDDDAELIHVRAGITHGTAGKVMQLRKNGNSNSINVATVRVYNTSVWSDIQDNIPCDTGQVIEYYIDAAAAGAYLSVRGWWKPVS